MSKLHFTVTECSLWEPQEENVWEGPGAAASNPPSLKGLAGSQVSGEGLSSSPPCSTRSPPGCLSLDSAGLTLSWAENTDQAVPPGLPGTTPHCLA